jgi:replicative DNA helicase
VSRAQTAADWTPPNDEVAEKAVIGSVFRDARSFARAADLPANDFYAHKHRAIWDTMRALWETGTPIDYTTVHSCGSGFELEDLFEIAQTIATASHIEHYAQIVRNQARLRDIFALGNAIAQSADRENADPVQVAQRARSLLERLDLDPHSVLYAEDIAHRAMEDMAARREGRNSMVPTGFPDIDHTLLGGGFANGSLNLLMGVTGLGKTELALQIAFQVAERNTGIVFYASLEMEDVELVHRIVRIEGGLDRTRLARGDLDMEQADTMNNILARIDASSLAIESPRGEYSTLDLKAHAKKAQLTKGRVRLVVLDYVQRLNDSSGRNSNREQDVALMAQRLKTLARELQCPVLALVQPNRDYSSRPNKRPRLSDLRESGRLEIEADRVLGLYRDDFFHESSKRPNIMDVLVLKNRSGVGAKPGASVALLWHEPNPDAPGSGKYVSYQQTQQQSEDAGELPFG